MTISNPQGKTEGGATVVSADDGAVSCAAANLEAPARAAYEAMDLAATGGARPWSARPASYRAKFTAGIGAAIAHSGQPELLAVCQEFIGSIGAGGYCPSAGKPATDRMRAAIARALPADGATKRQAPAQAKSLG